MSAQDLSAWSGPTKLVRPGMPVDRYFGLGLAVSGDSLLIAASSEVIDEMRGVGALYAYSASGCGCGCCRCGRWRADTGRCGADG